MTALPARQDGERRIVPPAQHVTAGGLVGARLGIQMRVTPRAEGADRFADALEVGLRRNPKRAHLLVSRVLGKHIPAPVGDVLAASALLGAEVRRCCGGQVPVVVGTAETATGLGHGVAAACGQGGSAAPYLHTTRRRSPAGAWVVRFTEDHSHATGHALAPTSEESLRDGRPLVLVDDELSSGNTAVNAIRAIHARWPRDRYVLASLADCRGDAQRAGVLAAIRALGAEADSVSLLDGEVALPDDVLGAARALIEGLPADRPAAAPQPRAGRGRTVTSVPGVPIAWTSLALPGGMPALAAGGWAAGQDQAARHTVAEAARGLPVPADARTLVLGDEELMYLPQLLAAALGPQVRSSTTTRTPAVVIDQPDYPLRTVLRFASTEDGQRPAYAYNVAPSRCRPGCGPGPENAPGFEHIVLVTDAPRGPRTAGLATALAASAACSVHVLSLGTAGQEERRAAG